MMTSFIVFINYLYYRIVRFYSIVFLILGILSPVGRPLRYIMPPLRGWNTQFNADHFYSR